MFLHLLLVSLSLIVVKNPQIEPPQYKGLCVNNAILVNSMHFPYLAFSVEHRYNNTIIETLSHNVRHKIKVYAFG